MNLAIRRILFPTDFSEPAQQAMKYAAVIAGPLNAELHVLHVLPDLLPPPGPPNAWLTPSDRPPLQIMKEAENQLVTTTSDTGIHYSLIVREVTFGNPTVEILKYASDHDIDLIVMGTHGRSGLAHALIGSVAEKVVRSATCPVLSVHPEGHQFVLE